MLVREPFILPLAGLCTGLLLSRFVAFDLSEIFVLIGLFAGLCVLALRSRSGRAARATCLFAFVAAGVLVDVAHHPPTPPELDAEDRAPVILSGCVVEPAVLNQDREQFVLELGPKARARVNLYVREGEQAPNLRYGQLIEIDAKVRRPHNFQNPGAFDYVHFLARQYIYWSASTAPGSQVRVLPGECGSRFMKAIFTIRTAALDRIEELYRGNTYNIAMMQAILIGESTKLEKVWTEQYRSTGTFHALVISGSHVAVLAAFFLFLLRLCFVPRGWAMLMTVLAAWLYALVTGWQAPVIRSAAGMTLFAICRYFYRQGRILNVVAAIAFFFLILDPEQLLDPSFQLSFLAIAVIGAFAIPLIDRTSGPLASGLRELEDKNRDMHLEPRVAQFRIEVRLLIQTLTLMRWPKRAAAAAVTFAIRVSLFLYELMLTSFIVQVGLALPMAVYFHRVSFSGLSANAIVVPLLGLVVPIGFIAVFTGWHLPALVAGWLLAASQVTVNWHARMEPNWRIPDPPLWLACAFVATLILAATRFKAGWLRVAAGAGVIGCLVLMVWSPFRPHLSPGILEMTEIDVGQGDSVLLAFPNGKLMLVDGGGIPSFGRKVKTKIDVGEDVVSPYLWSRAIRRIDVVALSHAHEDHIGGLPAILQNFEVGALWTGATPDSPAWETLRNRAAARHVPVMALQRGRSFDFGAAHVEIIAPSADYIPGETPKNNDSLAFRITFGRNSFLLTGDIEKQIEGDLVASHLLQRTDVLKVAHHGSKTSTTPEFLEAVRPAIAAISAGFENSYGHPNPQTLQHLHDAHAEIIRTDERGLISICSDGRRIWIAEIGPDAAPRLPVFFGGTGYF